MTKQRDAEDAGESTVDAGGNADPLEEVGPEECAPSPAACEFKAGSLDENPDASHPKFSEEVLESFAPEPDLMVPSLIDGLPEAADADAANAYAPPFTFESVVCVEDDREWVEMFEGEVLPSLSYAAAEGSLHRVPYDSKGEPRVRLRFSPDRIVKRWGRDAVELTIEEITTADLGERGSRPYSKILFVQPRRPRCEYYKRQVFSNDGQPDPNEPGHKIVFRNCTIRRSVGGAFMSIRDEAVFACDYRSPPDPDSIVQHLDKSDAERLRGDAHLKRLPIYGNRSIMKD